MTVNWHELLVPGIPWLEKVIRPFIVYFCLVAALRATGKRLLAQLNPFDFVVLLTISNTVQNAIIGDDNSLTGGLLGAAALLLANKVTVGWLYRRPRVEQLFEGEPDLLISNGAVHHDALRRECISEVELKVAAHKQGFESLDEIDRAVLDPGGSIFFRRRENTADVALQRAILERLDGIDRRVAALAARGLHDPPNAR
jgi:uncharacterized membrane protein YcaP (DUF421 family)